MSYENVRIDVHVWPHLKKYYEQEPSFLNRWDGHAYYISKTEPMGIVLLGLLQLRPARFRASRSPLPTITFDLGRHTETRIRSYLSDENESRFCKYLNKMFKRDALNHIRILNPYGVSVERALQIFYARNGLSVEDMNPEALLKEFKRSKTRLESRAQSDTQRIFPKLSLKTAS